MVPKRSRMYTAEGRCPRYIRTGDRYDGSVTSASKGRSTKPRNWIGVSDSHWSQLSQEGNSGSRVASHT